VGAARDDLTRAIAPRWTLVAELLDARMTALKSIDCATS